MLVADYGLGSLTDEVRERLVALRDEIPLLVVDGRDPLGWSAARPDVVTPNAAEAAALLGVTEPLHDRPAWAAAQRDALVAACGGADVLLTLDVDGVVRLPADPAEPVQRTRAHPTAQSRACGAGDTFTAAYTAARCTDLPPPVALAVAQAAADVVVGREETAVCTTGALTAQLAAADRGGLLSHRDLLAVVDEHRRRGHRVVFTNGCFDVLHRGHVTYLRQARALGDLLVVALNSDDSVARLKGPERPVNPLADRAGVVGAIECVDLVTAFSEDTPAGLIELVRPEIYAKGGDYTPEMLPETPIVERLGGQVRMLDYLSDHSTTAIVTRIRATPAAGGGPVSAPAPACETPRADPSAPEVDVLVPTRNRPVELATTLAGLAAQEHPFDVVISDQSDGPPSFDTPPAQTMLRVLRAAGHRVRTVVHPARHGVAEHRAALLARSTARYALFLDDDIWLEPGTVARLHEAIAELGCGLVGAAMQGVSFLHDRRPAQLAPFERWEGPPGAGADRARHTGLGPLDAAQRREPAAPGARSTSGRGSGGCPTRSRGWPAACSTTGRSSTPSAGSTSGATCPPTHCGEDVVAERRVMARFGGAGILPSGAYHLESPTTVPDREHNASNLLVDPALGGRGRRRRDAAVSAATTVAAGPSS